jgi:23S rRNA (guanine745-N1)-methyltransferase
MGVRLSTIAFLCPHCTKPLAETASGATCSDGHQFDRAREGYLNLLPAGRLKGRVSGDSDEMIRARRAFFDAGHYQPIATVVADAVGSAASVLDAGCGEGQYLAAVGAGVRIGIDVSKRLAARRDTEARFAVASSFRLPFADEQFDAVVSVFAPRPFPEFGRVLRADGVVVVASPGPDHLRGLTDLIYATPEAHEQRPHTDGERQRVTYDLTLGPVDLVHLLQMTPYWWKATAEQQAAVSAVASAVIRVDVVVARIDATAARRLPSS